MFTFIKNTLRRAIAYVKALRDAVKAVIVNKEIAAASEETLVGDEAFIDAIGENAEEGGKTVAKVIGIAALTISSFVIVSTIPFTILVIMEMVAVYQFLQWAFGKVIGLEVAE